MKILMLLDREFPPDIRVENEIEALVQSGHEVHIACYTRKGKAIREEAANYLIYRKPISNLIYKSSVGALLFPVYFNFWRKFIDELFSRQHFEAIHVHDLPLVQIGAEMKQKYGCMLTADLHENWPAYLRISQHTSSLAGRLLSPNHRWVKYEKEVLEQADHIIVVVDEAKDRLGSIGLPGEKIHVVSNTLNRDRFSVAPKKGTHENMILFYAGGINYHRGLQVVIRALAKNREAQPHTHFWILGSGRYRKELERLVLDLGVQNQVIFKGWQAFEKMTEMMMEADYALIPHLKTDHTDSTIPHKLFQYMYAGKPVISSDCTPIKRIIEETGSGYIYPSDDPDELAKLLNSIKGKDPVIAGNNGKTWVNKKYNWSHDSKVLNDIYLIQ